LCHEEEIKVSINGTDSIRSVRDSASAALAKMVNAKQPTSYNAKNVKKCFKDAFMCTDQDGIKAPTETFLLYYKEDAHRSAVLFKRSNDTVEFGNIAVINLKTGAISSKDLVGSDKPIYPSDNGYADVVSKIEKRITEAVKSTFGVCAQYFINGNKEMVPGGQDVVENSGPNDREAFINKFVSALEAMK
jgi:hypothetical protein